MLPNNILLQSSISAMLSYHQKLPLAADGPKYRDSVARYYAESGRPWYTQP